MPKVVVIGAGPAGSMAALLLARGGCSVQLLEQHRFPRDKVCGECLSTLAIDVLSTAGLVDGIRRLGAVVLTHAAVYPTSGPSIQLRLPRAMWGISRHTLDAYLLAAAREAGAAVRQPVRCEAIEPGARISLRCRDLSRNVIELYSADCVLVADGKGSLMGARPSLTGDFGIKAHFERIDGPRDTIELFGCDQLYGGLAAIEGGRWDAAFSVPAALLHRHHGDIDSLFAWIAQANPALRRRLAGASRTTDWLASPLPRYPVRNHWPAGVIPIGNAAAALEPITGEGIGLALRSAELAAQTVLGRPRSTDAHSTGLATIYSRLWRPRRTAARAAALIVSRPRAAEALLPLLARLPAGGRSVLKLLGK